MIMRMLAWAVTASALSAQSTGVNFFSLEKEKALGQSLAAEMRRSHAPVDDARAVAYVEKLGSRIAAVISPAPEFLFELLHIANGGSHEPAGLPGGTVVVPAALIASCDSEDELAAMLAHAMAHSAARHGTRQTTRGQVAGIAPIPLIFLGGWTGFGDGAALIPRGFAPFARQYELEADQLSTQWLAAAGFDPSALARYLSRTLPEESPNPAMPPKAERLQRLRDIAPRSSSASAEFEIVRDAMRALRSEKRPPSLRK